jgi:hypothetical protein
LRASGCLDLRHCAQLPRAHDLVFVEEEDGDAGNVDEVVDLRPVRWAAGV